MQHGYENRINDQWMRAASDAGREDLRPSWQETASSWIRELENRMGEHPKSTLATAAIIGIVIGWMVKRR